MYDLFAFVTSVFILLGANVLKNNSPELKVCGCAFVVDFRFVLYCCMFMPLLIFLGLSVYVQIFWLIPSRSFLCWLYAARVTSIVKSCG